MTKQKRRLGLAVPEYLYKKISDSATYHGKTINSTCLDIFWEYFETRESSNSTDPMGVDKEEYGKCIK